MPRANSFPRTAFDEPSTLITDYQPPGGNDDPPLPPYVGDPRLSPGALPPYNMGPDVPALEIPFNDVRDTPGWFENIRPIDVPATYPAAPPAPANDIVDLPYELISDLYQTILATPSLTRNYGVRELINDPITDAEESLAD